MKLRRNLVLCCAVLLLASFSHAQMPSGQWFLLHQEYAKPSMVKEYEATAHEFVAMVKANQATMPHFHYVALMGDDFTYTYVLPIAKMADIDGINADFGAMSGGASGLKFLDLMQRGNATIQYTREWVVGEAPEYSYTPVTPRLKPEEIKYFHYDFYYIAADKTSEAMNLCKEFAALFKSKNIPNGYKIYMPVMGPEMPAIIVRTAAKDPADFYTADMKDREMLGDEGKALFARAFAITRHLDQTNAWYRPDISTMTIQDMMMMKK